MIERISLLVAANEKLGMGEREGVERTAQSGRNSVRIPV